MALLATTFEMAVPQGTCVPAGVGLPE